MNNTIYFDHAATTPPDPEVIALVCEYMQEVYGNAGSLHQSGQLARQAVVKARRQVAELLGARPQEIFFTSGGSESDNLALKGLALANQAKGRHIITSSIEHHAVLHTCAWLEEQGFSVTYLPVDDKGRISLPSLQAAVRDDTILISIMFANNEIGTLQPVAEIGAFARQKGIYFHTDAVQAAGHVPIDTEALQIDALSLSGHKMYGPKGVGALYVRRGVKILPQILGGAQERGLRAGTENVPGLAGLGLAAEKAAALLEQESRSLQQLQRYFIDQLEQEIPGLYVNGDREHRLPGNVHVRILDADGEGLLLNLDLAGIAASSGSACTAGSMEFSHVLTAVGLRPEDGGALRMTLGRSSTKAQVDLCVKELAAIVARIRALKENNGR